MTFEEWWAGSSLKTVRHDLVHLAQTAFEAGRVEGREQAAKVVDESVTKYDDNEGAQRIALRIAAEKIRACGTEERGMSKHMGVNEGLNHFAKMQGGRTAKGTEDLSRFSLRDELLGSGMKRAIAEATPSPDTEALTKLHNYLFAHRDAIDMPWCAKVIEEARQSLTAAQAELQRLREELKIVIGICSSDTLPRKESK